MPRGQERVQWQSVRWPDNSTYEGLVRDDRCEVRGVFKYGNGDRYEGEFEDNQMSGYGVYVWGQEGSVYRGQWRNSMMDGCGVKISKQPNGSFLAEEGQFVNDEWVGDVMACTVDQARAAAAEADTAAQMARVFELGGSAPGSDAARAAEAATAAAAVAATAKPAPVRRHQRNVQPEALAPASAAPVAPPVPLSSNGSSSSTATANSHSQPRDRPNGPLGLVQEAVSVAVSGAQQALQHLLHSSGKQ